MGIEQPVIEQEERVRATRGTLMTRAWARRARWAGTAVLAAMSLALPVTPAQAVSGGSAVPSTNHSFSYTVAVLLPVRKCTGALIDTQHVVTTATCVKGLQPSEVKVRAGSHKYNEGGITKEVTGLNLHPEFNSANYDNDIAVLTLESPLTSEEISTYSIKTLALAAADSSIQTNDYGTVTGFGATDANLTMPDVLRRAYLKHYGTRLCQQYKRNRLTDRMFCAGDPTGVKDLCPGDQGAPLVDPVEGKLLGIYSWGASCGLAAIPPASPSSPVFTRISSVTAWINTVTTSKNS
ncbi:serine protease [Streptomyces sp. NPDC057101]|uniref:serine protease n=1 Tax=Streptomyces sp. NPDC057101 TaxID=3346020 RepID=UPI003637E11F